MRAAPKPALCRAARVSGWIAFAAFELAVFALTRLVASIRCCAASGPAGPQSPGEWAALALFAVTMLLLGAAVGGGAAFLAEGLIRIGARIFRRGETGA